MFGYIRTDSSYLFVKDDTLYEAMYCGLCKGIAEVSGQIARTGLSYDITFFSVIMHNICNIDVKVEKQNCWTHCVRSQEIAEVDEMTRQLGAFNTVLVYYKYTDDIKDGDKGKGKRFWFESGFQKAKKRYPEIERIVRDNMANQEALEKAKVASVDRAADATATMVAEISDYILGEYATEYTRKLFYIIGKWIYMIDALDDYDKDLKKGAYNPFVLAYGAESQESLMEGEHGNEVRFFFTSVFAEIRECLGNIQFHFNRDLSDNILLRGMPVVTKFILNGLNSEGECKEKPKKGCCGNKKSQTTNTEKIEK